MDQRLSELNSKMQKAIEIIRGDITSIRTGRASPSIVENIVITSYGGSQKLKVMEMGTINVQDSRTLIIQPWDISTINDIYKGIMEENIGLTPVIDSNIIRISFPLLTEERREEFVKMLKQKLEAGKIMIRQVRHDKMSELKRMFEKNEITEDDRKRLEEEIQKMTDEHIGLIDELGQQKEEELMKI